MTRDYKQRRSADKTKPIPGWVWLATGVAIGAFGAFLAFLAKQPHSESIVQAQNQPLPAKQSGNESSKESPAQAEKLPATEESPYSFYKTLPNMTIEVPVDPLPPREPKEQKETAAPDEKDDAPQVGGVYILQVGSFRSFRDADNLKARLALLGIETKIETVSVNRGDRWHRVRVGPYATLDDARQIQQKLERNRIKSILLRLSG